MTSNQPLTEFEFDQLDELFLRDESEILSINWLDGYLAGLAAGPHPTIPGAMIDWILDVDFAESSLGGANLKAKWYIGLIDRYFNAIKEVLETRPQTYVPRIKIGELQGCLYLDIDEWCLGFSRAIDDDRTYLAALSIAQPQLISRINYPYEVSCMKRPRDALRHYAIGKSLGNLVRQTHAVWR